MYYPFFRGKQYELVTVREMAPVLKAADFCPVIEPVRETLGGLHKALKAIESEDGRAIVVVNPHHGDLSGAGTTLTQLLQDEFLDIHGISAGILLKSETSLQEALECYAAHSDHGPAFVHSGFADAKALADSLGVQTKDQCHIFLDRFCGKLYQKHFKGAHRILLKDGFQRKRNRDYDFVEPFSDLHATFTEEGMDGFGDFLIVGDDFIEGGGPAYAVAIHLTFIDPDQDDAMQIYHFVSDRQDTPKDPAGKFGEALAKMIDTLNSGFSKILETSAVKEFRNLHERGHFPGLGYTKKLSMNHHIETLADYFQSSQQ
ncbi:MAG: sce7725 family protein [Bryobacterales bacterium]|nr:sce7725 family protein [Bryobacterales bacterium]